MTAEIVISENTTDRLSGVQQEYQQIRENAESLLRSGASGLQVSSIIGDGTRALLLKLIDLTLAEFEPSVRDELKAQSAVVAVGGTGRGEMAPYSDVDILFLRHSQVPETYEPWISQLVRDCWDSGFKLGHSVRTIKNSIQMASQDTQFATSLIEANLIWGDEKVFHRLVHKFYHSVIRPKQRQFIDRCCEDRNEERIQQGNALTQLEPDVKKSPGGLRDLHLIRWVGFARYGTADLDMLRMEGAFTKNDVRALRTAHEFLEKIRLELHFASNKAQNVFTRDDQLLLAKARQIEASAGQRPVERLMQTYFQHSKTISDLTKQFVARTRPQSLLMKIRNSMFSHRSNGYLRVSHDFLDVVPAYREKSCSSTEELLKLFKMSGLYSVDLNPHLIEEIKLRTAELPREVSQEAASLFLEILNSRGKVGHVLRSMYEVGLLEILIPAMSHAHCLLQFNQYHSYTVDEHTLRAVESIEELENDESPLGTAFRKIARLDILRLAILLHDLGKGFEEDHSVVGKTIAEETSCLLYVDEHEKAMLVFLVHKHLLMTHLAFRRDIADPNVLFPFSHEVGSPQTLRMLYVLSAADLQAVGPGVWTDWKAELLSEVYDRAMMILGGKHYLFLEEERAKKVRKAVHTSICELGDPQNESFIQHIDRLFDTLPPHYLTDTPPARIASDLDVIDRLGANDIYVEANRNDETGTVEYRVFTREKDFSGCFHKITGALSAKRLEILSAQICTTSQGLVIDGFRVIDNDYSGFVPEERIQEVTEAVRDALTGRTSPKRMFQKHIRFDDHPIGNPISEMPARVALDNKSSERCTILDVFAHDQPGLLYTISRAIFKFDLSVELAKISTHLDQVVDVFYVTDLQGKKIDDGEKLAELKEHLYSVIIEFEKTGYTDFTR